MTTALPLKSAALALFVLLIPAALVAAPAPLAPLLPPDKEALVSIPEDPAPSSLILDTHYFVSNEEYPERFYQALRKAAGGGIYVGVGAEQNYLFAGWARAEVVVLLDFDQLIVDLHTAYQILLLSAGDPAAFIERWSPAQASSSLELLRAGLGSKGERQRVQRAFSTARPSVFPRLKLLAMRLSNMGIPTFLGDPSEYQILVNMIHAGRVLALRGDLTGQRALQGLAAAARRLRLPVRAVYLSNVEHYFDYDSGLGDNLQQQPYDEHSLLLRTYPFKQRRGSYRYVVQRARDFGRWLQSGRAARLHDMVRGRPLVPQDDAASWWVLGGP